jgi:hypothetical protein
MNIPDWLVITIVIGLGLLPPQLDSKADAIQIMKKAPAYRRPLMQSPNFPSSISLQRAQFASVRAYSFEIGQTCVRFFSDTPRPDRDASLGFPAQAAKQVE